MYPTTQVRFGVIINHDGSKVFVDEEEYKTIWQDSANSQKRGIGLKNKTFVAFSSIAKLLTIDEFYKQYPQELPAPQKDMSPYVSIEKCALSSEERKNGLIRGLKQFIAGEEAKGIIPLKAKAMLDKWKLKQVGIPA